MASQPHRFIPTDPRGPVAPPARARDEHPRYGVFRLRIASHAVSCYGTLYPDGVVHLSTPELAPVDFASWQQFVQHITPLGAYSVVWLALPVAGSDGGEMLA